MSMLEEFKRYYKEAQAAKAAYEKVCGDDGNKFHAKYPQFKILVHSNGKKDSGMQALLLQDKKGEMFLSIQGTEITSIGDVAADVDLYNRQIPLDQIIDLIDFIEKQVKPTIGDKEISVVGHSLGGTLAEIVGKADSGLNIKKVVSFNSPSAKELTVLPKDSEDFRDATLMMIKKHYELKETKEGADIYLITTKSPALSANKSITDTQIYKKLDKTTYKWLKNYEKPVKASDKFIAVMSLSNEDASGVNLISNMGNLPRIGKSVKIPNKFHGIDSVSNTLKFYVRVGLILEQIGAKEAVDTILSNFDAMKKYFDKYTFSSNYNLQSDLLNDENVKQYLKYS